jgi:hypothetical protein
MNPLLKVGDRLTKGRKVKYIEFLPYGNQIEGVFLPKILVEYLCIDGKNSCFVHVEEEDGTMKYYYGYQVQEMLKVKDEIAEIQTEIQNK